MRIIQLHKVPQSQTHRMATHHDSYTDTDDVGEPQALRQPQEPQEPVAEPVAINADAIRCFYTRRADRGPGTRITFKDGGGFAVTESYDEVLAQVGSH